MASSQTAQGKLKTNHGLSPCTAHYLSSEVDSSVLFQTKKQKNAFLSIVQNGRDKFWMQVLHFLE